jgi:hypothetical protein
MNNEEPFDPKDHQFEDVCMRNMLYQAEIVRLLEENATLKAERDEARREICDMNHMTGFLSGDYALSRDWDCFKNGYPKELSEEAIKFRDIWNAYSDKLRKERDEARRKVCELCTKGKCIPIPPREIAEQLGWDCFKEVQ